MSTQISAPMDLIHVNPNCQLFQRHQKGSPKTRPTPTSLEKLSLLPKQQHHSERSSTQVSSNYFHEQSLFLQWQQNRYICGRSYLKLLTQECRRTIQALQKELVIKKELLRKNSSEESFNYYNDKLASMAALHSSGRCKNVFTNLPLVVYRRCKNISDILVRAKLPEATNTDQPRSPSGSFRCNKTSCTVCPFIEDGCNQYTFYSTGQTFKIKSHITCETSNVIYFIQCTK